MPGLRRFLKNHGGDLDGTIDPWGAYLLRVLKDKVEASALSSA